MALAGGNLEGLLVLLVLPVLTILVRGGGGSGGTGPPPALPPGGGTGAAISKTQFNSKLNPTLLVDNWSIELLHMQASWSLVYCYRLIDCKQPWSFAIVI